MFLVGESLEASTNYRLYDADSGVLSWTSSFITGSGMPLNYTPAVASGIVLLGGSTTAVRAVEVSTGTTLWQDSSVGDSSGIDPYITDRRFILGGKNGIRAGDPMQGPSPAFWTMDTTTEGQAPISVFGEHVYLTSMGPGAAGGTGPILFAAESTTGNPFWSAQGVIGFDTNVIATESRVFVNNDDGFVTALDSTDGSLVWSRQAGILSTSNPTALAYNQLYLFADSAITATGFTFGPDSAITALDPNTGDLLWRVTEPGEGINHATIANNVIYYYHEATGRVRARDAFTGALLWSIRREDVRNLATFRGSILLLFAERIEIYRRLQVLYFAHLADGGGQTTLLAISNRTGDEVSATLSFFDDTGAPLSLDLEGFGTTSDLDFTVAGGSSARIQTLGGDTARKGWARIVSDGPLSGSSIFQARDMTGLIVSEAGVSASALTGQSNVFTEVLQNADPSRTLSSGLAIANPSDEGAVIELSLLGTDGAEIETAMRVLLPGEQIAEFVTEFFPGQMSSDVVGSIQIRSDVTIIVTSLRTQGGFQLSSLASGQ